MSDTALIPGAGTQPRALLLRGNRPLHAALALSFLAIALTLALRPVLPIDETRYLTVAWEMWRSGDYLVPHLNGAAYSHKPPLLFWLINAIWAITGPSEWAARLVPALFLPACILLTYRLGKHLADEALGGRAALVLASLACFAAMATPVMFDALLTACVLLAVLGLLQAVRGGLASGFAVFSVALGLGVLAKGPVVLVHTLPAALLAPLWVPARPASWGRWYAGVFAALLGAAAIGLGWALPAAFAGGPEFESLLLWKQTSGRMVNAFAHARPFWFYLALLPALLFPWVLARSFWSGLRGVSLWNPRLWRLPLIVMAGSVLILSAVSGKQIHYVLPILPMIALLIARLITPEKATSEPAFAIMVGLCGAAIIVAAALVPWIAPRLPELNPLPGMPLVGAALPLWWARRSVLVVAPLSVALLFTAAHVEIRSGVLAAYEMDWVLPRIQQASTIGFIGEYEGEFSYAARLSRPVEAVKAADAVDWLARNPDGVLVSRYKDQAPDYAGPPVIARLYRSGWLGLWSRGGMANGNGADAAAADRR